MQDIFYMRRAIGLACQARGFTNPNPMVGAVIVKDGKIIGEGYHKRCGELHAERNAFANLRESAEGATLFVTLEPCCHYGKTPPCTEAIIENKIAKVVIGSRDPNPLVAGKGAKILREHGIEVVEDFLREECDEINPVFFHYITTKRPYVTMKYAMTADGKIATKSGASKWITGEAARGQVQIMRHNHMAIMAGIGTVLADDPMLNVRVDGLKSPVRVICDSNLRIPLDSKIVKTAGEYRTIVFCTTKDEEKIKLLNQASIEVEVIENAAANVAQMSDKACEQVDIETQLNEKVCEKVDLKAVLSRLGEMGIDSVFVEGGAQLNDSLMRSGCVNQLEVFIAPKVFGGKDAKSPVEGIGVNLVDEAKMFKLKSVKQFGDDVLLTYVK